MKLKTKLSPEAARRRFRKLRDDYDQFLIDYKTQLDELRSRCPHSYSYDVDPSGNHDSLWECTLCGHRTRKLQ